MAEFDGITQFIKSGVHRLQDAEELMQLPSLNPQVSDSVTRHTRGAVYLAGYAVECLVKAYLIELESRQTLQQAQERINARRKRQKKENVRDISGAAGHNIGYLLSLTDLGLKHGYDPQLWGRVGQWSSVWRYNPNPLPRERAEYFLADVRAIVAWLRPQIYHLRS